MRKSRKARIMNDKIDILNVGASNELKKEVLQQQWVKNLGYGASNMSTPVRIGRHENNNIHASHNLLKKMTSKLDYNISSNFPKAVVIHPPSKLPLKKRIVKKRRKKINIE